MSSTAVDIRELRAEVREMCMMEHSPDLAAKCLTLTTADELHDVRRKHEARAKAMRKTLHIVLRQQQQQNKWSS